MRKSVLFFVLIILTTPIFSQFLTKPDTEKKKQEGKYFYIKSAACSQEEDAGYWDQPGQPDSFEENSPVLINSLDKQHGKDQRYRFETWGYDGWYKIAAENGGYLELESSSATKGTEVLIRTEEGRDSPDLNNQLFGFQYMGEGRFAILCYNGGGLGIYNHSLDTGTAVGVSSPDIFSIWYIIDAETGDVLIPQDILDEIEEQREKKNDPLDKMNENVNS